MHPDADTLLAQHPDIETVEALITDCNGAARGKWLPIEKLSALLSDGIKLPKSAVAQDAWGRDVPRIALDNGDPMVCQAVPDSLVPVLTATGVDRAQVMLTMFKDDGEPLLSDPRQVLAQVVDKLEKKGLAPRVAIELEFNLFKRPDDNQTLRDALPAKNETGGNLYGLSSLDEHAALFDAMKASFETQGLPYEGVLKKQPRPIRNQCCLPDDAVAYCDQVIRMQRYSRRRRAIRCAGKLYAKAHGKSGRQRMHVHCSLLYTRARTFLTARYRGYPAIAASGR